MTAASHSPFTLKPIADKKLMRLAKSVYEWIKLPNQPKCDLAIHFPLSQAINPISPEIDAFKIKDFILNTTIPLAILTPFPEGQMLVAVFDVNSEDNLITEILEKTGVKVIVSDDFSELTPRHIKDALSCKRETQLYLSKAVNPVQFKAYEIIAKRVELLKEHSPFILLHEVMASSVASKKQDAIHTNRSSWFETWTHASKSPFDCLVVSKDDMYPLLALEFDGKLHSEDGEQKRKDALKNEYCNKLSLPLIRINSSYLNKYSNHELQKYDRSGFMQGLVIALLCFSYQQRTERITARDEMVNNLKKIISSTPNASAELLIRSYLDDDNVWMDEYISQQIAEQSDNQLSNEFMRIYNVSPKIQFHTDNLNKITASLPVPAIGKKPALTFNCPSAIKAEIYGIGNPDALIKKYMSTFLLRLAILAGE